MKQADLRDMLKKTSNNVCTLMVSPDPFSSPINIFSYEDNRKYKDPDNPQPVDK
jgi:hypothetical protein